MPLMEGQFQVRDLIMGPGTSYDILRGTNPFNRTVRAEQSGPRAWNHGGWSGVEWADPVAVSLYIRVRGATRDAAGWLAAQQALSAAFAPVGEAASDVELRFAMGGREYLMRGRPRMVEPDLQLINSGKSVTQAAFVALDPLIYAGAETVTAAIGLPAFSGGLTLPVTVPFAIGATQVGGAASVQNEGTADTGMLLRIDGPVSQPLASLLLASGEAQTLRFNLDLGAGQWLDIDTAARSVLLDGTSSRRGQTSGPFPMLPPGTHTLRFGAAASTGAPTLTARFRSAWW